MPRPTYSHSIAASIGHRIMELREKRGLSQAELAERIDVSYQQVQKYENGSSQVTVVRLIQIAGTLNVDIHALLNDVEEIGEHERAYRAPEALQVMLNHDELKVVKQYRKIQSPKARQLARSYLQMLIEAESL